VARPELPVRGSRQGRDPCDGGAGIPVAPGVTRSGWRGKRTDLGGPAAAELGDELLDGNGPKSCERPVLCDPDCAGRHTQRFSGLLGR
jgi:hypothetical protein